MIHGTEMLTESGKIIMDNLVGFQDGEMMDRPRNDRLWIPICQQSEEEGEKSEQGKMETDEACV